MIRKIDHVVITVEHIFATLDFYKKLGFEVRDKDDRYELYAGDFKINVHIQGKELFPHAQKVQIGSSDFCFEITEPVEVYKKELESRGVSIELGVVSRMGVQGEMNSIYLRDPDGNLVEFCSYE